MTWLASFEDRLHRDRSLADLTTIRVGGRARYVVEPRDEADVSDLLGALAAEGLGHRVVGGGSNLLPPDHDVAEVVVHPVRLDHLEIRGSSALVGAGRSLGRLVNELNAAGLAGAHVLAGIPGQVGGALCMNAGGRHGDFGRLVEAAFLRLPGGRPAVLTAGELAFGYRTAHVPAGAVVCAVALRLEPTDDSASLKRESGRILKEKNSAQPTTTWNFGCMWKNPVGRSAGVLVQDVGLLGATAGGARISPRHGNFVENVDRARAVDILALMERAEEAVAQRFGIRLEREVRVWT